MAITPEDWLLMYMNAGIDCVAITDHNSGEWIDVLKNALATMDGNPPAGYRKLYLFPGVEISANGNTHILAIFDPTVGTAQIQNLLGAVQFPAQHIGTTDAVSPQSVEVIIKHIHEAGGIAIPAHVDKPSGLFLLQGHTLTQALKSEGLLAIELIDKAFLKPQLYEQAKLHLTEILGSDSHIAAQVGTQYTWVKMSVPTLDALKLALHDGEDGVIRNDLVTLDPNTLANRYFIKSLSVTNGFKAGNGTALKAEFSPWLTSVIGGRGSGKSTILNYLRIALTRTDEMPKEVQVEFDRFNQIGKRGETGMLKAGTIISVEIVKDGKLHLVTWNNSVHTLQEWNDTIGAWEAANTISNVKELFPVQIFSQKELYALTGNPSKLIELIDSQFDKPSWIQDRDKLVEKWIADRASRRQLRKSIAEESNLTAQLGLTNNKIALYESSTYRETLSNFNKFTEIGKFFSDTNETVRKIALQIEELERAFPTLQVPPTINDVIVGPSLEFIQAINASLTAAKAKITEAIAIMIPYSQNLPEQYNALPWFQQFATAKQAYDDIAESIKELGTESYETLIQRRGSLNDKLALISTQKEQLESSAPELQALYTSIVNKEKELRLKRKEIIGRWKAIDNTTNPFLIIELEPMADADNADSTF